jgi:hypothetical protein
MIIKHFSKTLELCLLVRALSNPLSAPFVVESGIRAVDIGAVGWIYELEFDAALSADVKVGLHVDIQLCRSICRAATERLKKGDHLLGMDACRLKKLSRFLYYLKRI